MADKAVSPRRALYLARVARQRRRVRTWQAALLLGLFGLGGRSLCSSLWGYGLGLLLGGSHGGIVFYVGSSCCHVVI